MTMLLNAGDDRHWVKKELYYLETEIYTGYYLVSK